MVDISKPFLFFCFSTYYRYIYIYIHGSSWREHEHKLSSYSIERLVLYNESFHLSSNFLHFSVFYYKLQKIKYKPLTPPKTYRMLVRTCFKWSITFFYSLFLSFKLKIFYFLVSYHYLIYYKLQFLSRMLVGTCRAYICTKFFSLIIANKNTNVVLGHQLHKLFSLLVFNHHLIYIYLRKSKVI